MKTITPSIAACAMLESIAIEDPAFAADAGEHNHDVACGASLERWLDTSGSERLRGTPLLAFDAVRRGIPERVVILVEDETGRPVVAASRMGPEGYAPFTSCRIEARCLHPISVTLATACGPSSDTAVMLGARLLRAFEAAL